MIGTITRYRSFARVYAIKIPLEHSESRSRLLLDILFIPGTRDMQLKDKNHSGPTNKNPTLISFAYNLIDSCFRQSRYSALFTKSKVKANHVGITKCSH